jgi:hypothetical protein
MPEVIEQEQELKQQALTVVERAKIIKIADQPSYDAATSLLLNEIIPFRKRWKDYWEALRVPAHAAYQGILDKFNEGDKPAEAAEKAVKSEIRRWDDEQERKRQELQRKAQEEAEREAEEERLRAAIVAEEAGASEPEVQAIVDAPVVAVAQPVAPTYAKAAGVSGRDNWKAKVTDFPALVKAAAKDKSLLAYLLPNEQALNNRAKADKQTLNVPGVVPWNDRIISGRGR